jgi:hypothetical protein
VSRGRYRFVPGGAWLSCGILHIFDAPLTRYDTVTEVSTAKQIRHFYYSNVYCLVGEHEAVVVNMILSGGRYANEWIEPHKRLKCYLKDRRRRSSSRFEENDDSTDRASNFQMSLSSSLQKTQARLISYIAGFSVTLRWRLTMMAESGSS